MTTSSRSNHPNTTTSAVYSGPERRVADSERRSQTDDRRDPERVMDDDNPRRSPEHNGRRLTDA